MARTARKSNVGRGPAPLLDGLSDAEAEELLALEEELRGGGLTLRRFIEQIAPAHAPIPRHLEPLIDLIQRARLEPIKACISMPPGHAKTITLQRAFAWWLLATPWDRHAYVSYSDRQAWAKSKEIRDLAANAGVSLDRASAAGGDWRTVEGGGLLAAGMDGRLTGNRVTGLAVIDDPFKSRKDAESTATREDAWTYYLSVVRTRLERASVIVVHTRWHVDDLIARLVEREGFSYVNLRALAERDDSMGRVPGEALWPDLYSASYLADIKGSDEYEFAAMYQGEPRPRGANVFGSERYYDPDTFSIDGCRLFLFADPAASTKTWADPSAIIALAMKGSGAETEAWVLDVYRKRVTVPQFVRDLRAFQQRHGNPRACVESVGGFKAIPQMIEEIDPDLRIEETIPVGDKFTRAQPVATAWNAGRVYVPKPTMDRPVPWLKDFLAEVSNFTGVGDAHDDQVDCLSGAWNEGFQAGDWTTIETGGAGRRRV